MTTPMRSVAHLRANLEGFASRYAALRVMEGASYQPLLDQFNQMEQVSQADDYQAFADCDRAFHQVIIEMAAVPALEAAWAEVFRTHNSFRVETLQRCWPDLSMLFESHRPVVEAIASGRPHDAEDASVSHLDAVWFRLALMSDQPTTTDETLPRDPLSRTCAYLAFHYQETIRLPIVAKEIAGCTAGHLARLFREHLDLSFSDYLIELRLQKGAQLLRSTGRPIREIAKRVGYADPSRFGMHFRRRFGQTPCAYRDSPTFQPLLIHS